MTTATQKRKLSKSAWLLVFILIGTIITVAVLAVFGIISLQFLADIMVGYMNFGASGWVTATIAIVIPFLAGILFYWTVKTYFIGNKVTNTMPTYTPQGQTLSAPQQKDTETVISS